MAHIKSPGVLRYETEVYPSGATKKAPYERLIHAIGKEEELHNWTREHFEALGLDAALIGSEVDLGRSKKPDILAIDTGARICIVEFKRDKADREIFAQVFEYAQIVSDLLTAQLDDICKTLEHPPLSEFYRNRFGRVFPKERPRNPTIVLVAESFSEESQNLAVYLNREHRFRIQLLAYQSESTEAATSFSFDSVLLPEDCQRTTKAMPANLYAVRFEESGDLLWNDCLKKNILVAPSALDAKIHEANGKGIHVLVDVAHRGYVALALLRQHAIPKCAITPPANHSVFKAQWEVAVPWAKAVHRDYLVRPEPGVQPFIDIESWQYIVGTLEYNHRLRRRTIKAGDRKISWKPRSRKSNAVRARNIGTYKTRTTRVPLKRDDAAGNQLSDRA